MVREHNVVVLVMDALRTDRIGAMGGRDFTPRIDELATESAVFSRAFSTTNTTDPAVTSIQTGRYPLSSGLVSHGMRVTDIQKQAIEHVPQLPEVLSEAGYATGKFGRPLGRWHRNGFDVYPSRMETEQAYDEVEADNFDNLLAALRVNAVKSAVGGTLSKIHPSIRDAAATTYDRTVGRLESESGYLEPETGDTDGVLENFRKFVAQNSPFYAFVHLMDTHVPYHVDPDLVVEYLDEFDYDVQAVNDPSVCVPEQFHERVAAGEFPEVREKYYFADQEPSTAVIDAHYDAAVTEGDRRIGRFVDTLRENSLLDETLVIFLADHGESLTEHGIYYDHHGLYDVSVRIPLFVRPPGGADRTVDEFAQITDIAPTVASYTGVPGLEPDGESLSPAIEGTGEIGRSVVVAEEDHTQRRRMIRTDTGKLIYLLDGDTICRYCDVQHAPPEELYDLEADPGETNNLAATRPERVADLRERAEEIAEGFRAKRPAQSSAESGSVKYDDEETVQERLEALGYR
jgi:arylsulfatase A-like enzyme